MQQVLLLHGAIGSQEQLYPLRDQLSLAGYEVHSVNFSGHGGKSSTNQFSIEQFGEEVYQYIQEHSLGELLVFGYSMGGYVALFLASKYPGIFKKVCTLGTKFNWTPEIAAKEVKMLNPSAIEEKVPAFAQILATRHGMDHWKLLLNNTATMLTGLGNNPLLTDGVLQKIDLPVLLLIGQKDNMVSIEETEATKQCLQQGSIFILQGTPHPIEQVNIGLLVEQLNNFFHH